MSKTKHLIDYFIPETYDLHITSDSKQRTFSGVVTITGKLGERFKDKLYLHSVGLTIESIKINSKVHNFTELPKTEEIEIEASGLSAKNITLVITYSGTMSEGMTGIYPCPYMDGKTEKVIIGTQFESHYARMAFPCIDEPLAKATFKLTLRTPKGETAISNTEAIKHTTSGAFTTTEFAETPKMSTYIVAFAHGDITSIEATTKNNIAVRCWTTKENIEYTRHSLDVAVKSLDFLEDYFGIPYPLSKCDLIGLPNFSAGAMENWGLITFREASLFVDPENTTQGSLEHVTMTVVHEVIHQWFGNLVTMKWWNDLWLNEGFASFMPYIVMDSLFPEWNVWTQFLLDDFMGAQSLDALKYSHPIEVTIDDPDEIRTIFDSISYDKGASVINMLHSYLGPDIFRSGLREYLTTHAYSNTTTNDLWDSLAKVSGKPVAKFMKAWTAQTGFPVVSVNQDIQKGTLELSQERFMINPRERKSLKETTLWPIPLTVTGSNERFEMNKKQDTWQNVSGEVFFQKLNAHHDGFYMLAYEPEHLAALATQVEQGKLSVRDRIGLLHDAFELSKAGYIATIDALALLQAYQNENDPFVWDVLASCLGSIKGVMGTDALRDAMKPFVRTLIEVQLNRLGWDPLENETYQDTILRPTILGLGVSSEHPTVITEAVKRFAAMKKPADHAPDTRGAIYQTIAQRGKKADYEKLYGFYTATHSPQEKVKLAAALCSFSTKPQYMRSIAMIKSNEVKAQDIPYWVAYSFMNRFSRTDAWEWFKQEWAWIQKTFESDVALLAHLPQYAGRAFSTDEFAKEYAAYFKDNIPNGIERQIKQTIESIEWHADWNTRDYKAVLAYFQDTSSK